ncbi:hypothetical protein K493DRAFT_305131 [Basidiobolus meristosporus CBS 931.73]|uniref:Uncharacterized protein n=1 Tax=Basidiobolus meristosporus CBS 931.73 TaxID=1314790 RepID=A0A1Y1XXH1_9FUNG|nr:hypothetical protein K493DRAFT_305131 [Basidiobolus meristosporus CBS 931.73]|eukprot:ORX90176.1 hypothetical protein K493DRAFT_305131 [Basidiobolus meristosporus CBS 931.73]
MDALLALPVESPSSRPSPLISSGRFTKQEFQRLLREAYGLIMEKDRELTLAAKLRSMVIEENDILQEKYLELVEYIEQLNVPSEDPARSSGDLLKADYGVSPPPPPPAQLRLRSAFRRHTTHYDEERVIASLEQLNLDLQQKVDHAMDEKNGIRDKEERRITKLENEVEHLRRELELACQTIQQLERRNHSLSMRYREDLPLRPPSQQSDRSVPVKPQSKIESSIGNETIDMLLSRVSSLEERNATIVTQKAHLEQRLQSVLSQLEETTVQANTLEESTKDYAELESAFERQSMHVAELSQSVEDQGSWIQSIFTQFSPRSVPRVFSPRSPSRSSFLARSGYTPASSTRKRRTLLDELEYSWNSHSTSTPRTSNRLTTPRTIAHSGYITSTPIAENPSLGIFHSPESPLPLRNGYLQEAFDPIESGESSSEEDCPPRPAGPLSWLRKIVKSIIKSIFKWCRFLFFLCTAAAIAIYRGPNGDAL